MAILECRTKVYRLRANTINKPGPKIIVIAGTLKPTSRTITSSNAMNAIIRIINRFVNIAEGLK
jgi:hypothetical protein